MSRHWSWLTCCESGDGAGYLGLVAAELDVRLPDCLIKTCGSLQHLDVACCDDCHTHYPHRQMSLLDLPDVGKAWVCHEIELAIYPGCSDERHALRRNFRETKTHVRSSGSGNCPED